MSIYVFEVTTEQHFSFAVECHYDWYVQAGYIEPNSDKKYLDEWSKVSKYFLVAETNKGQNIAKNNIIGVVRLILANPFPMTSKFNLWQNESAEITNSPIENQCEVSALSWASGCGLKAIPYLYRAVWQSAKRMNRSILLASLDKKIVSIFKRQMLPVRICGETKFYMGSETTPLFMKMCEIENSLSQKNPELLELAEKGLDVIQ